MKNFKKITINPLMKFTDLNLNVVKQVEVGPIILNKEVDMDLNKLFDYINQNPEITKIGVGQGEEVFLSTQIKASANRKKIFTFPEPDPVCVYYNIANENLEKSYDLKNRIISKEQNFDAFEDFGLFTEYFGLTSQGIIFLITTLEGFINQFFEEKNYIIKGENKTKEDLEKANLLDKLKSIIPALLNIDFSESNNYEYCKIVETNGLRDDLIHLKRTEKSNNTSYQKLFKKLIDYDHHKNSEAVYTLLNTMKPDYFKIENNG